MRSRENPAFSGRLNWKNVGVAAISAIPVVRWRSLRLRRRIFRQLERVHGPLSAEGVPLSILIEGSRTPDNCRTTPSPRRALLLPRGLGVHPWSPRPLTQLMCEQLNQNREHRAGGN
jgi:hypothetical protein